MPHRAGYSQERVLRHSAVVRLQHWTIALSGLALLFSGFGQFPLFKRYMVDRIPGLAWSSDFSLQLTIHLAAGALFTAAVIFHALYQLLRRETALLPRRGDAGESWRIIKASFGRGEEPPSGKYLAEQRVVYALFGVSALLLVLTGLLKTAKNLPGISLSPLLHLWSTMLHNVGTTIFLLLLFAHLFAFVLKINRPLFAGMFTGRVKADYARHRHALWEISGPFQKNEKGAESMPSEEENSGGSKGSRAA